MPMENLPQNLFKESEEDKNPLKEKLEEEKIGYRKNTIEEYSIAGGRGLSAYEKFFNFNRKELEGMDILDLGAGAEVKFAKEIEQSGIKTNIVSLSPDFAELRHRKKALNSYPEAKLITAIGQELPFKQESFDRIFMYHVCEHLSLENLVKVIAEIARVLKNGGRGDIGPILGFQYEKIVNDKNLMDILQKNGIKINEEIIPSEIMPPVKIEPGVYAYGKRIILEKMLKSDKNEK